MAVIGSAIASGVGSIVNTGVNAWAQKDAQAFNAAEAQKQRDYEERLSNTAYSRSLADMAKNGLNANLISNGLSASTPSGATASSGIGARGDFNFGNAFSNAVSAMIAKKQIDSRTLLNEMNMSNAVDLAEYKHQANMQLQLQKSKDIYRHTLLKKGLGLK